MALESAVLTNGMVCQRNNLQVEQVTKLEVVDAVRVAFWGENAADAFAIADKLEAGACGVAVLLREIPCDVDASCVDGC